MDRRLLCPRDAASCQHCVCIQITVTRNNRDGAQVGHLVSDDRLIRVPNFRTCDYSTDGNRTERGPNRSEL